MAALEKWEVDPRAIWEAMPKSIRSSPPLSPYIGKVFGPFGSPKLLRPRDSSGRVCAPIIKSKPKDEHSDQSDSEQQRPTTPTPQSRSNKKSKTKGTRSESSSKYSQSRQKSRPYCSQQCLRGLAKGWLLDLACPNISYHKGTNNRVTRHQLTHGAFLALLRQQLAWSLDENCQPLGLQGARGALFKITLASHGYTMIAKGTVLAFVKDLQWESQIYQHLEPIQGLCVPVCLGNIDLVNPYYYDMGVKIIHIILLSWAGDSLCDRNRYGLDKSALAEDVVCSVKAIHRLGVLHHDVRAPNICWNSEVKRAMLIDFERSELLQRQKTPIRPSGSQKRRSLMARKLHGGGQPSNVGAISDVRIIQEVLAAKRIIL
jgi:Lipopolysaccharide kinase (Kdo/WaaP) family